ncbi:hypothetical protein BG000_003403 [Podila horticola]|nr:hypothetical protein BG000_003403 [Podila horticola]
MTNPLDSPEIVYRIAWFLPLWIQGPTKYSSREFQPKDLAACLRVNRMWNSTLTPLLWMVYDDGFLTFQRAMGLTGVPFKQRFPATVIQTHGHHIRYAKMYASIPVGHLRSTHLKEIDLDGNALIKSAYIVLANPQVSVLRLSFPGMTNAFSSKDYKDIRLALESLSQLKVLSLDSVRFRAAGPLAKILNKNSGLQELYFNRSLGVRFDGCKPLKSMRRIGFEGEWHDNWEWEELIQLCPNLEEMNLHGWRPPVENIAKNIRQCCPKLTCVEFGVGELTVDDTVLIIQATPRLVKLVACVHSISAKICDALLGHAEWLETLHLSFQNGIEEGVQGTNRILESCSSLRSLQIHHVGYKEKGSVRPNLMKEPWNCTKLERLYLRGLVDNEVYGSAEQLPRFPEQEATFLQILSKLGWSTESSPKTDRVQLLVVGMRFEVFLSVCNLKHLYQVHVEGFEYVHKDRMGSSRQLICRY